MGLKLIYGKAGSGKSTYCFQEISRKIQENTSKYVSTNENTENIFLITPEQFSFTAEKKLMEEIKTEAVLQAEVIHLSRLAKRVITELGIKDARMTKCGKAMLISHIMNTHKKDLQYLSKSEENIDLAISTITELKKHGVTVEILKDQIEKTENKYLKTKLKDIEIIYEKYDKQIKESYIDEADELTILSQNIGKISWIKNSIIYIDEFAGFTYPEYQVIKELIKYAKQVNITMTIDNLEPAINPDTDIFYSNKITTKKLLDIVKQNGLKLEEYKEVNNNKEKRFKNKELEYIESHLFSTKSTKYEQNVENISLFLAKNQYTEIENIAKEISNLVKNEHKRYNQIAIITKNIQNYANLAKVIFEKYDIPIFIDEKRELSQNIIIQYILAIFEVLRKNYSKESVFQYAKMGFTGVSIEDIFKLENYCTKWGIKQNKFKKDFIYEMDKKKEEIEYLNKLRKQIIEPIEELKQEIRKNKTARAITENLYRFLQKQKIEEQIILKMEKLQEQKREDLAKEYKESYEILINILDEIVTIFNKDTLTIDMYTNLLKQGLKASGLGKIPGTQDQVIMGDVDRSRSHKVDVIFIIGLNDGVYPNINKNDGFISDEERQYLKEQGIELAKGMLENLYDDNFNIYKAFTTAEEKIYLSYSSADTEGKALRPSIYITKIKKLFPKLKEKSDVVTPIYEITNPKATYETLIEKLAKTIEFKKMKSEKQIEQKNEIETAEELKIANTQGLEQIWKEVYYYYKNKEEWCKKLSKDLEGINYTNLPKEIEKDTIEKLYGNVLKTSVSRLETYKKCAFSYFLKYGLNLKQKEELKIQSFDTGSFMHEIIDIFFSEIKEQDKQLSELIGDEETIQKKVNDIIETKLDYGKYSFTATIKYKILIKRLEKMVTKALKYIIESLVYSEFNIEGTEIEFAKGKEYNPIELTLEDGRKIQITGKIDRVDIAKTEAGNYLRIIDYKSSARNVDLNEVYAGIQIQLLTYLDAICEEKDLLPAGILYFNLIEKNVNPKDKTQEAIEEEIRKNFKMKGLILADIKAMKMQDINLKEGVTSQIVPAGITTKGEISKRDTSGVNQEEFQVLQNYIEKIIKQIGREILQGKIDLKPTNHKGITPCKYCEYHSICAFDSRNNKNKYLYIENFQKDDIIKKMKEK